METYRRHCKWCGEIFHTDDYDADACISCELIYKDIDDYYGS